jgi:hypothetical protein
VNDRAVFTPTTSRCGAFLDRCRCSGPVALDPEAMQARHRASVERARRSGWASWLVSGRPLAKPRRTVKVASPVPEPAVAGSVPAVLPVLTHTQRAHAAARAHFDNASRAS